LSSLLAALVNQASAFTVAGVVPRRLGNTHPSIAPEADRASNIGKLNRFNVEMQLACYQRVTSYLFHSA